MSSRRSLSLTATRREPSSRAAVEQSSPHTPSKYSNGNAEVAGWKKTRVMNGSQNSLSYSKILPTKGSISNLFVDGNASSRIFTSPQQDSIQNRDQNVSQINSRTATPIRQSFRKDSKIPVSKRRTKTTMLTRNGVSTTTTSLISASLRNSPHEKNLMVGMYKNMSESRGSETYDVDVGMCVDVNVSVDESTETKQSNVLSDNRSSEDADVLKDYTPYYMTNFLYVLEGIVRSNAYEHLFSQSDQLVFEHFMSALSTDAQRLYVRLFQRKSGWLRVDKLSYKDIHENIVNVCEELCMFRFLSHSDDDLNNLETALTLLTVPELKLILKKRNISLRRNTNQMAMRARCVDALVSHGRSTRSLFSTNDQTSTVLRWVKEQCVGGCVRLRHENKDVIDRVFTLFFLHTAAPLEPNPLAPLLLVDRSSLVYNQQRVPSGICSPSPSLPRSETDNDTPTEYSLRNIFTAVEHASTDRVTQYTSVPAMIGEETKLHVDSGIVGTVDPDVSMSTSENVNMKSSNVTIMPKNTCEIDQKMKTTQRQIFTTREEFLEYHFALTTERKLREFIENRLYASALAIVTQVAHERGIDVLRTVTSTSAKYDVKNEYSMYSRIQTTTSNTSKLRRLSMEDIAMPVFRRMFTPMWVHARVLATGVDVMTKLKMHEESVRLLEWLLGHKQHEGQFHTGLRKRNIVGAGSRGRWWNRLTLNLLEHMKDPRACLRACIDGLQDPYLRTGHRHAVRKRLLRLLKSKTHCSLVDEEILNMLQVTDFQIIAPDMTGAYTRTHDTIFSQNTQPVIAAKDQLMCTAQDPAKVYTNECTTTINSDIITSNITGTMKATRRTRRTLCLVKSNVKEECASVSKKLRSAYEHTSIPRTDADTHTSNLYCNSLVGLSQLPPSPAIAVAGYREQLRTFLRLQPLRSPPSVTVDGRKYSECVAGKKSVYINRSLREENGVDFYSVEDYALHMLTQSIEQHNDIFTRATYVDIAVATDIVPTKVKEKLKPGTKKRKNHRDVRRDNSDNTGRELMNACTNIHDTPGTVESETTCKREYFESPSVANIISEVDKKGRECVGENAWKGVHAENAVLTSLFTLLMWDCIFLDVPDVFVTEFQTAPLDMYSDDFYANRKLEIERRLDFIATRTPQQLRKIVEDVWEENYGVLVVGLSWDRDFLPCSSLSAIAMCLGGCILSGICRALAVDYRGRRGGLPDLTLWNESLGQCKMVEVKSPNDRMSEKQEVWADLLMELGVHYYLCCVTNTNARKIPSVDTL
eukprot:CFRG5674T1